MNFTWIVVGPIVSAGAVQAGYWFFRGEELGLYFAHGAGSLVGSLLICGVISAWHYQAALWSGLGSIAMVTLIAPMLGNEDSVASGSPIGSLFVFIPVVIGVSAVGALLGAIVGRRWQRWAARGPFISMIAASSILSVNTGTLLFLLAGPLTIGRLAIVSLLVAPLLSGALAQLVAPRRMSWWCGAGTIWVALLLLDQASTRGLDLLRGALLYIGVATPLIALGARIAWSVVRRILPPDDGRHTAWR